MKLMKTLMLLSLALLIHNAAPLQLEAITWSPPVTLTFSPPVLNSRAGVNRSGNYIIAWLDTPSNNYLTSIYIEGSSSWSTPIVLVSATNVPSVPSVAINASGYAVASWIQVGAGPTETIESANLVGNSWVSLGTVGSPTSHHFKHISIDVDPSGNILATYLLDNGNTTNTLFAATHTLSGWSALHVLFTSNLNTFINPGSVPTLLDNNGNGIINWATEDTFNTNTSIYASTYIKSSGTYTPFTSLFSAPGGTPRLGTSMSGSGNAALTWTISSNDIYASVFTPSSGWSTVTLLGSQANTSDFFASINDSADGEVVNDALNTLIRVSSYSNGSWSTLLLSPDGAGFSVSHPVIAIDSTGNAVLVWAVTNLTDNTSTIQYSTRNGLQGIWAPPSQLVSSPPNMMILPAFIVITPSEEAVLLTATIDPSSDLGSNVEVFVGSDLLAPQSPENFQGKTRKNRFPTQTDLIHHLSWSASPSTGVTSYKLYRNGELIAEIPADAPLEYNDHNRHPHEVDVYTLTAIRDGSASTPASFTFP